MVLASNGVAQLSPGEQRLSGGVLWGRQELAGSSLCCDGKDALLCAIAFPLDEYDSVIILAQGRVIGATVSSFL